MDLAWRMHRLGDKCLGPSVIQLALNPVQLFLVVEPRLRKWRPAERPFASLQQFDHVKCVVALLCLDSERRTYPTQKDPGSQAIAPPRPGPAFSRLPIGNLNNP